MQTILGIIGSPRRRGNCELLVKAVSQRIERPHCLRLWLIDMKSRFKTQKARLREVVRAFGPDHNEWIRPPAVRKPR